MSVTITEVHDMGDGTARITGTVDGITEPTYELGESTTRSTVRKPYTLRDGAKVYMEDMPAGERQNVPVMGEDQVEVTHPYPCQVLAPPERWAPKVLTTTVPLATISKAKDKLAAAKAALAAAYPAPTPAPKPMGIQG